MLKNMSLNLSFKFDTCLNFLKIPISTTCLCYMLRMNIK